MKNFSKILFLTVMVLGWATNSSAIGLEVAAGGWAQNLDGELSYKSALVDDSIDFDRDGGYGDEDRFFGRLNIDLPILPNVYFMGTQMEFEGDGTKSAPFSFGGTTFSETFYSKAKFDHYDLALYYGVPLTGVASLGTIGIDIGINVRQLKVDMVVRDKTLPTLTKSVDETLYIPMGFLAVQFKPTDKLSLEGELRGIAYSENHYYDLIARLKYRFAGPAFGAVGWRYEELAIDEKDIIANINVSGPFVEAGLQF